MRILLTSAERRIIREMCFIASGQSRDHRGSGEGDYQGWTQGTFRLAQELGDKLGDPDPTGELLRALRAARDVLRLFYDSSEDNRNNPPMQTTGRVLNRLNRLIAKHGGQ